MDAAVALVESYLRVNGYFTATEWPVIENSGSRGYRTATDIDVMGFRFAGAQTLTLGRIGQPAGRIDPALDCPEDRGDMIIAEVKEGEAVFNPGAHRRDVLQTVLLRFGCCAPDTSGELVDRLIQEGHALMESGHQLRLVAFGSTVDGQSDRRFHKISMSHVFEFLQEYIARNWAVVRHVDIKDPVLDLLGLMEKARRG